MTDIVPPTNVPVEALDTALKSLLNVGVTALETALESWEPWTGLPVIKQIIDYLIGQMASTMEKAIATEGTFLIIEFQDYLQKTAYVQSISDYRNALVSGDQLKIQAARDAWENAVIKFGQYSGTQNP